MNYQQGAHAIMFVSPTRVRSHVVGRTPFGLQRWLFVSFCCFVPDFQMGLPTLRQKPYICVDEVVVDEVVCFGSFLKSRDDCFLFSNCGTQFLKVFL